MTLFIIKTFEIAADPNTAKEQVKHIVVPEKYYDFVKSYWYNWIHDPKLVNILPGNHKMHVIYSDNRNNIYPDSPDNTMQDHRSEALNIAAGYVITNDKTIELLVVSPEYQGHGLGSKLLDKCLEETKEKKIRLEVHVLNIGAIKLYRRYKFRTIDSHGPYLVMQYNKMHAKKYYRPRKIRKQ